MNEQLYEHIINLLKDRLARLGQAVTHTLQEKRLREEKQQTKAALQESETYASRDITERKWMEEALLKGRERYQTLIQNLNDIIYIIVIEDDPVAGTIELMSAQVENILGYQFEEFMQNPKLWFQILHPDDVPSAEEAVRKCYTEKEPVTFVFRMRHKTTSEYRWLEDKIVPQIDDHGKVVSMFGVARDITERTQLEEQFLQAQKMEVVGRLAGGVAHDFNNLLTIINGYSSFLLDALEPRDPRRADVEEIKQAGKRAAALTRQLLAFSRKQILEPRVLNLNEVLVNMDKMLRRLIGEDIELTTIPAPDLRLVKADIGQMEQVLLNLVVNARDAMPQGGHLIIETANVELDETYVERHLEVTPGCYVLLAVTDTGIGMSPEVQARIFEPFFTTKGEEKGTGLGLSTVYGIVKQSGGSIEVYSEKGQGTTLKLYLPRVDLSKESLIQLSGGELASVRGTETILVVEDTEEVCRLAVRALTGLGYTVLEASSGKEALQLCKRHTGSIHLLLTDVVMPWMSGKEVVDEVTALRPGCKVLYMSGYTDEAVIRHGVLDKGIPFLQKPFSSDTLARRVREVLDA